MNAQERVLAEVREILDKENEQGRCGCPLPIDAVERHAFFIRPAGFG